MSRISVFWFVTKKIMLMMMMVMAPKTQRQGVTLHRLPVCDDVDDDAYGARGTEARCRAFASSGL